MKETRGVVGKVHSRVRGEQKKSQALREKTDFSPNRFDMLVNSIASGAHSPGRAMAPRKRKRGTSEPEVVTRLRRGGVSILDAVFTELPDVFYGEILPKLDLLDTQNLGR